MDDVEEENNLTQEMNKNKMTKIVPVIYNYTFSNNFNNLSIIFKETVDDEEVDQDKEEKDVLKKFDDKQQSLPESSIHTRGN